MICNHRDFLTSSPIPLLQIRQWVSHIIRIFKTRIKLLSLYEKVAFWTVGDIFFFIHSYSVRKTILEIISQTIISQLSPSRVTKNARNTPAERFVYQYQSTGNWSPTSMWYNIHFLILEKQAAGHKSNVVLQASIHR